MCARVPLTYVPPYPNLSLTAASSLRRRQAALSSSFSLSVRSRSRSRLLFRRYSINIDRSQVSFSDGRDDAEEKVCNMVLMYVYRLYVVLCLALFCLDLGRCSSRATPTHFLNSSYSALLRTGLQGPHRLQHSFRGGRPGLVHARVLPPHAPNFLQRGLFFDFPAVLQPRLATLQVRVFG